MDGIKGFALIGIIWYHLAPGSLPGGFVGVEVFFTISGFLLTTSLLRERERTGRMAPWRFYRRRLARLWPAMAFMIATVGTLGLLIDTDTLVGMPANALAALTFTSNWHAIASGGSYFATTSPQLLQHLWFVALLAQVTLALPPLVALLCRLRAPALRVAVPAALAVLSALGMGLMFRPDADPTRVYFGTDTHCFGLLFGVALAFAVQAGARDGGWPARFAAGPGAWLATGAMVGIVVLMRRVGQDGTAFRGGLFAAAVLSVVLLAGGADRRSWMGDLFMWRPLALLGRYSYGVYLWHWPAFVLIRLLMPGWRGSGMWVIQLLALAAGALMTALSWRMVERPVDALMRRARRHAHGRRADVQEHPRTAYGKAGGEAVVDVEVLHIGWSRGVPRWLRAAATVLLAATVTVGFVVAMAHAPAKSSVQVMLERNQGVLDQQRDQREADAAAAAEAKRRAEQEAEARAKAKAQAERELDGGQITVIGDSVTVGASPALEELFPGVVIDAKTSRSMAAAPGIVSDLKAQGQLRRFVVVSLNTNGAASVDQFEQIAAAAGKGHVLVIVTAYGDRSWIPVANQAAADYVRAHPSDAMIADWNGAIGAHTDMLTSDGIHPQVPGQDLYAATVKGAITDWIAAQAGAGQDD